MNADARVNLILEAASGCLFLILVLFVGLLGVLAANWVGSELWAVALSESPTDLIVDRGATYLSTIAILLIPIVLVALAILAIRSVLIQAEPSPWES